VEILKYYKEIKKGWAFKLTLFYLSKKLLDKFNTFSTLSNMSNYISISIS
jgi:hypothetical protein